MSDSKLPQVRPANAIQTSSKNEVAVVSSGTRTLTVAASASAIGAVALFIGAVAGVAVTLSVTIAIALSLLAIVLLVSRQLVAKSMAATSSNALDNSADPTSLRLQEMRKQVSKCKFLENVEAEGNRASDQAQQLWQQFQNLQTLLGQKFDPSELTYSRYKTSIDDTCLAIAENLLHIKNLLESLNIQNLKASAPAAWEQQKSQVDQALQANAAALAELTGLHTSLNQITTQETHRDQLEQSLEQIRVLAERAKQYSKN